MKAAWEDERFSSMLAWSEPDRQRTYQELIEEIQSLPPTEDRIWIQEDQGAYQNACLYLAAWKFEKCLCLLPKSWPENWKQEVRERISRLQNQIPADCFYLLPTSGSTGHPKLVVVTRDNWKALMQGLLPIYQWPPEIRVALSFEGGFDPFIAILFLALSQGGTLFPVLDSDKFDIYSFARKNKIQVWASVPSLALMNWARKPKEISELLHLQYSLFTGEVLSSELVQLWRKLAPLSTIENLYGPVEATVWATRYLCESPLLETDLIPIGQPLQQVQAQVQKEELVLIGPQVAHGYLAQDGLQSFAGVYFTGDLIEEKDSQFIFKGRKDQQVKIRGQRIELEA
ncbi:MAG: AMP-binding protein, partial [Pseudobdellovibrionaceae bacterium]